MTLTPESNPRSKPRVSLAPHRARSDTSSPGQCAPLDQRSARLKASSVRDQYLPIPRAPEGVPHRAAALPNCAAPCLLDEDRAQAPLLLYTCKGFSRVDSAAIEDRLTLALDRARNDFF